jgi:Autophagy-related protein 27
MAAGTALNIKQKQLQGLEAVPHIEFWRELPLLIMNTVNYIIQKVLGYSQ